jgi:fido (protein-threonine AMPylation protein)
MGKLMTTTKNLEEVKVIEFLKESNAIENEFRDIAFEDAKASWEFAIGNKLDKIDISFIKDIHKILCCRINPKIAGKIREQPVYVGSYLKGYIECMDYTLIEKELEELCHKWNNFYKLYCEKLKDKEGKVITEKKEKFVRDWHIKFERCHPYEDGNGRTGRILMNFQRLRLGLPLLIIHRGSQQAEYYKWFKDK